VEVSELEGAGEEEQRREIELQEEQRRGTEMTSLKNNSRETGKKSYGQKKKKEKLQKSSKLLTCPRHL
jgi:hypothetical protein